MTLSNELARVASKVKSKPVLTVFTFLVVLFVFDVAFARDMAGQHTAIRRLDCSVFCRKTGFSGYVGGCQCGFTLFANKRSQLRSRLLLMYPENNFLADDDSAEDVELRPGNKDRSGGLGSR